MSAATTHHELTPMEAELARLRAENERLKGQIKPKAISKPSFKVSQKGAISVYGLGRWPVTLYASQWQALNAVMPELGKFIVDNAASLAQKEA